jgi:hypothetical protein
MSKFAPARLEDVERVSRRVKQFFLLVAVLTVLGTLATLFGEPVPISLVGLGFHGEAVTAKVQTLWVIETVLSATIALKVFYHLIRLFGLYAEGKIFTPANVLQMRQVGLTLLLAPALWIIVFIVSLPEVASMSDEWVRIVPSFPGNGLVGGAIVVLVSWIMDVGRELRDEHDLVI